jgi:hypothetical protein
VESVTPTRRPALEVVRGITRSMSRVHNEHLVGVQLSEEDFSDTRRAEALRRLYSCCG